jgi:hypothetical protein
MLADVVDAAIAGVGPKELKNPPQTELIGQASPDEGDGQDHGAIL